MARASALVAMPVALVCPGAQIVPEIWGPQPHRLRQVWPGFGGTDPVSLGIFVQPREGGAPHLGGVGSGNSSPEGWPAAELRCLVLDALSHKPPIGQRRLPARDAKSSTEHPGRSLSSSFWPRKPSSSISPPSPPWSPTKGCGRTSAPSHSKSSTFGRPSVTRGAV